MESSDFLDALTQCKYQSTDLQHLSLMSINTLNSKLYMHNCRYRFRFRTSEIQSGAMANSEMVSAFLVLVKYKRLHGSYFQLACTRTAGAGAAAARARRVRA